MRNEIKTNKTSKYLCAILILAIIICCVLFAGKSNYVLSFPEQEKNEYDTEISAKAAKPYRVQ